MGAPSDGTWTFVPFSPGSLISYSLNGAADQTASLTEFSDNFNDTMGDAGPDDSYLLFNAITLAPGDTIVFRPGSWTLAQTSDVNPAVYGTYIDEAFLMPNYGVSLGDPMPVPEPSTYAFGAGLIGLGTAVFVRRKRGKAKAA